jgi:cation:H+ antiporter
MVAQPDVRTHTYFMLAVSVIFAVLCFFRPLDLPDALILIGVLLLAILATTLGKLDLIDLSPEDEEYERVLGIPENQLMAWFLLIFGGAVLPLGATLTVDGATAIATRFGVDEAVIGATIVALGTSLPELSVTVVAALRRHVELAIGNAVGSNTINILFVIGFTALLADMPVPDRALTFDIWYMLGSAILLTGLVVLQVPIGRRLGSAMLLGYLIFLVLEF